MQKLLTDLALTKLNETNTKVKRYLTADLKNGYPALKYLTTVKATSTPDTLSRRSLHAFFSLSPASHGMKRPQKTGAENEVVVKSSMG